MARFGRVMTAMVTPFRQDSSLDVEEAQRLASHLVDNGSDGIVVCGSTGEAATLTRDEKIMLYRAVAEAVGDRAIVIAGTGTYSTVESVELTREAEKTGCHAALVVTPYYNKPPQRAILEHFRTVGDASQLPVILYDIPVRTALKIDNDTLLRAAEHPRIVAVKESAGDLSALARFIASKPDDFEIYCGNDDWTLPLQALGAVGVVSVLSHVAGPRIQEQVRAFERGDIAGSRAIQCELMELHRALFCTSNPIPVKAAMRMLGFDVGSPRPPLAPATPDEEQQVREALTRMGAL